MERGIDKGIEEGMKKGIEQGKIEVATKLKEKDVSVEIILNASGLSKEVIDIL